MPLLELKGLTMRFGGLTAVNKVDFAVEPGQIFSVIGPNGAGKTTVFNAITGVYEPTEGEVRFDGRDPRKPFGTPVVLAVALIGLLTGLGTAVLSTNFDAAWQSVISANYTDPAVPFPVGKAAGDFFRFLDARVLAEPEQSKLADLEIREKDGKWRIRSSANRSVVEEHDSEEKAEARLEILRAMVALGGSLRTTVKAADGRWQVQAEDKSVLESFDSPEAARQRLLELAIKSGKLKWRLGTRAAPSLALVSAMPEQVEQERGKLQLALSKASQLKVSGSALLVDAETIGTFPSPADAESRLKELTSASSAGSTARILLWVCFVLGAAIGASGTWATWKRSRRTPDVLTGHGLARTFQNIRLFPDMLAIENVLMGMHTHLTTRLWQMALHTAGFRREENSARRKAQELLDFVGIPQRAQEIAKSLPYGDQRRLEIARALGTEPKLLLLDEPGAGMNPAETSDLMKLITKIRDRGVTVVLIEHHMKVVMGISDRIVVLDYGTKIAEGTPAEVKANPKVIEAYLGKEEVG